MSAKRRADTIAKFCIPVQGAPPAVAEEPVGRSLRHGAAAQSQSQAIEIDDDGDNASDFVPDNQSDYSATELESDEQPPAKRRKGKGKGKAKGKARSSVLEALRELEGESNPRVMLISLKGEHFVSKTQSRSQLSRSRSFGP